MGDSIMNFIEGISITVSSMMIVFFTLLIIAFILESFKHVFKTKEKEEVKDISSFESKNSKNISEDIEEEEKVILALAASMMASKGKVNPNLRVTKIIRIK